MTTQQSVKPTHQAMVDYAKDPRNAGLNLKNLPPAKAVKDDAKAWNHAQIAQQDIMTDQAGNLVYDAVCLVSSTGQLTPADITGIVKMTSNGNLVVSIKRHEVPAALKAARQAYNEQSKAAYQANGGAAGLAQRQQATPAALPGLKGSTPVTSPEAPMPVPGKADEAEQYQAFLAWQAAQQQQAQTPTLKGSKGTGSKTIRPTS